MALTRREFIKSGLGAVAAASVTSLPLLSHVAEAGKLSAKMPLLMVATGDSPALNVRKAVEALGGIEKFIKPGDRVFLKPNSITRVGPEFAANTHPDVVAEVARLCRKAGASEIWAYAHDDPSSWIHNGIGNAIEASGGIIGAANAVTAYQQVNLPMGLILRDTMVIREFLEADVFINLPVAKHHAAAQLTLALKNYMGLNWDRQIMHRTDLDQTIADLVTVRKPDLTVIDATRMMLNNGPSGPGTVREERTIVASTDIVAADAYTATLFKHEPGEIRHIRFAAEMGLGVADLKKMEIRKLTV
jgi:uncharacterized protein (DUF362 family)